MKKIKKICYPIKRIVLPILLIAVVSIYLSSIFKFIDYEGNGFLIKLSEITFNYPRKVACILLFFGFLIIYRRLNKDKEYAPTNIYGDYHVIIYYIAWLFVGYKKVNLKMKPIPLQFQLLSINKLECFDDTEYSDKNYKYKVNHIGKLGKDTKQINIIVSDTYPITDDKIPKTLIDNYTINLTREGEKGIRVKSQELIELLIKEVQNTKQYCKTYNLFLSTPASTNMSIFNQVFHTERDKFILNIYQQDSENEFKFKDTPNNIKC